MWILPVYLLMIRSFPVGDCHGDENVKDVIILGAGTAGISAAAKLTENGIINFLILEGAAEIGGRVKSGQIGNIRVELGNTRIQGEDDVLLALADETNTEYVMSNYSSRMVYDDNGNDVTSDADMFENKRFVTQYFGSLDWREYMDDHKGKLQEYDWPDLSMSSALKWIKMAPNDSTQHFVERYVHDLQDGNTPEEVSYMHSRGVAGNDVMVTQQNDGGFVHLLRAYADSKMPGWESKVMYNKMVTMIEHNDEGVVVHVGDEHYEAKYAIVTFSLGVLQEETVTFDPDLPNWKRLAIYGFDFKDVLYFYLRFPTTSPWFVPDDTEWIGIASTRRGYFPFWQNYEKFFPGSRTIRGIVLDRKEVARLTAMTDNEIRDEAVEVLRRVIDSNIPDALDILVHRWSRDPLHYGSYSHWPTGYTSSQHSALKAPLGRVHFAGEAYNTMRYGTMQGALESGRQVAYVIKSCMDGSGTRQECGEFIAAYAARGCTYKHALNYDPNAKEDDGSCWLVANEGPTDSSAVLKPSFWLLLCLVAFPLFKMA